MSLHNAFGLRPFQPWIAAVVPLICPQLIGRAPASGRTCPESRTKSDKVRTLPDVVPYNFVQDGASGAIRGGCVQDSGHGDLAEVSTVGEFARRLTRLREEAGLTVRDVAAAVDVPSSTIGGYFGGRHLPPARQLDLLPRMLAVCGIRDPDVVALWVAALARVRRAPGRRYREETAPYRGLASFQEADTEWFFGREDLTERLVAMLGKCYAAGGGLLVVVGPSGSGKSSLLRAGLLAALREGRVDVEGSSRWPHILFTPGSHPMTELAAQLSTTGQDTDETRRALSAQLGEGTGLLRLAARVANPDPLTEPKVPLLLVVDQFEEVFTSCTDPQERDAFLAVMAAAGEADPEGRPRDATLGTGAAAVVVIGLRADFYAQALQHPQLTDALQDAQLVVGPMTKEQVCRAITEPARKARLELDQGLLELLVRDLAPIGLRNPMGAHDAGALPMLSHALLVTWKRSLPGRLTVAGYRDSGGIEGAVAATAEAAFRVLEPRQQELTRRLFLRMVHIGEGSADTRRRVPRDELILGGGRERADRRARSSPAPVH